METLPVLIAAAIALISITAGLAVRFIIRGLDSTNGLPPEN
jgi:hypothetical protein